MANARKPENYIGMRIVKEQFDQFFFLNDPTDGEYDYYSDEYEEYILKISVIIKRSIVKEIEFFKYVDYSPAHGRPYTKTLKLTKDDKEELMEICDKCFCTCSGEEIDDESDEDDSDEWYEYQTNLWRYLEECIDKDDFESYEKAIKECRSYIAISNACLLKEAWEKGEKWAVCLLENGFDHECAQTMVQAFQGYNPDFILFLLKHGHPPVYYDYFETIPLRRYIKMVTETWVSGYEEVLEYLDSQGL